MVREEKISIKTIIRRYWKRAFFTWMMVFLEGLLILLFPLLIGKALDDYMTSSMIGVYALGALCLATLITGAGRRFYDTRVYSKIYKLLSGEIVMREDKRSSSISKTSARLHLFAEFIDFLENSMPAIIDNFIRLAGTVVIIFFMDIKLFLICLTSSLLILLVYYFSNSKIYFLNSGQNDEFENQVDIITRKEPEETQNHFNRIIAWKIRLSDLETINFSLVWLILSVVLVLAIVLISGSSGQTSGSSLTIIMYIFGFMESVMVFPLYYQQLIRLHEVSGRL